MRTIEIAKVKIEQRQRRKVTSLQDLKNSILEKGLLHPIVLRADHTLVAGERRLRAIQSLGNQLYSCDGEIVPPGQIPFILITDLNDIQYREAELEENLLREDLTWDELVAAREELHRLRQARDPAHTVQDTARELAKNTTRSPSTLKDDVARALVIAPHLDDPKVRAAKSENEAYVIVSRKLQAEFVGKMQELRPPSKQHSLIHGDFREVMESLEQNSFDCIIADPPYGIEADKFGSGFRLGRVPTYHEYSDSPEKAKELYHFILAASNDLCKKEAHLYLFCDIDFFLYLRNEASQHGWTPRRTPLIWSRGHSGLPGAGLYEYRRSYDLILFATRGNRKCNMVASDLIAISPTTTGEEKLHAAQKPADLYVKLLQVSCNPGDSVLDPCCGSGPIFPAADRLRLRATGVEIDKDAHDLAATRLEDLDG